MSNLFDQKVKGAPLIRVTSREEKEQAELDKVTGQAISDFVKVIEGRAPAGAATIGGDRELAPEQRARLPYVLAAKQPCLLCSGAPYVVNFWKVPQAIAQDRPDSTIFFSLCEVCFELPGFMQLVEAELLNRVKGQSVKSPLINLQ